MKKYILVLDLDETLFHTNDKDKTILRPFVKQFIKKMSQYMYLIVYTAAVKSYADKILKDNELIGYFDKKLYRSSLVSRQGFITKDLEIVVKKLMQEKLKNKLNISNSIIIKNKKINFDNIIFIDNLLENCICQPSNAIIVKDYIGQKNDKTLKYIEKFLLNLVKYNSSDVRKYLKKNLWQLNPYIKNVSSLNLTSANIKNILVK